MIKSLVSFYLILGLVVIGNAWAEKYYVFIEQKGDDKGDIIAMLPVSPQYEPTKAELSKFKIVILDVTEEQRNILMQHEFDVDGITIINHRLKKVDVDTLNTTQKQEISLVDFNKKVTDKSISVVTP